MLEFVNKIIHIYTAAYLVVVHVIAIALIGLAELDFSKPLADIVLGYIFIVLAFALCDLCFLLPSIGLVALASIVSFLMAISVPLFLFLSLFQLLGSTYIHVLEFGFIKTLIACLIVTPIGVINLMSTNIIFNFYDLDVY